MDSDSLPPPSYEEAMSSSQTLHTYCELGVALQSLDVSSVSQNGEILYEHNNVRLYFISPDGSVVSTSEPHTLKIIKLQEGGKENRPNAILQVGEWIYPLVAGVSPCFRTEFGAFILPDVDNPVEGSAVGIILPDDTDSSVNEILSDILLGICSKATIAPQADTSAAQGYSSSISQGIVKGAQYISQGLVMGAEKASGYMNNNTPRLIQHLNSADGNPSYVHPNVTRSMQVAKDVTNKAVHVTGYVATKISGVTMALGQYLAPHIQRQGARLLSSTTYLSEREAADKMGDVLQVAAGAVEGFGTVYAGLESSAHILGSSLTNNTVRIVEHKFGHPAAQVTGDTLYTVGNVYTAGNNMRYFTPKGLVKITAKSTGKAVVEDYRVALRQGNAENVSPIPGPSSEVATIEKS